MLPVLPPIQISIKKLETTNNTEIGWEVDQAQILIQEAINRLGQNGAESWEYYGFKDKWCAMFVSLCAEKAGLIENGVIPKHAFTQAGVAYFQQRGQYINFNEGHMPQAGDIIYFDFTGQRNEKNVSHVAIVEKVIKTEIYTIEGNAGASDTVTYFEGSSVVRHIRRIDDPTICGYATPDYGTSIVDIDMYQQIQDRIDLYAKFKIKFR